MNRTTLTLGASAIFAVAGTAMAGPALAAPGDPLPSCVSTTVGGTAGTTTVTVRNNCAQIQRVRLIVNGGAATGCAAVAPGAIRTWSFTPAGPARTVQC